MNRIGQVFLRSVSFRQACRSHSFLVVVIICGVVALAVLKNLENLSTMKIEDRPFNMSTPTRASSRLTSSPSVEQWAKCMKAEMQGLTGKHVLEHAPFLTFSTVDKSPRIRTPRCLKFPTIRQILSHVVTHKNFDEAKNVLPPNPEVSF